MSRVRRADGSMSGTNCPPRCGMRRIFDPSENGWSQSVLTCSSDIFALLYFPLTSFIQCLIIIQFSDEAIIARPLYHLVAEQKKNAENFGFRSKKILGG